MTERARSPHANGERRRGGALRPRPADGRRPGIAQIDKIMTPTEKEDARKLSAEIMADLKNLPPVIALLRDR